MNEFQDKPMTENQTAPQPEPPSDNRPQPNDRSLSALAKRVWQFLRALYERLVALDRRHPNLLYAWCFLLPAGIITLNHFFAGVWPIGEMSVLTLDLNGQYVFFFEALRDWVYGEGSLLYSFSRSLGGEFLGIYAYYLASPLSYIVALFPKQHITEALFFMFVLKTGLCGFTFSYFLRKNGGANRYVTVTFSTLYALIAYGVVMQHNTMWIDCMYLLPLIALGINELIVHKKYKLYTLCLALAIFSNFYIGYMMCFFVALYFFCAYFSMTPEQRNPNRNRCHFPRALARMAIFSAIALLMACIIVIPAYYGLQFGKTEFTRPNYAFRIKFDLLDFFFKLLIGSFDTVRPEGLPTVYSGMLTLLLLPFYFLCRKINLRERFAHGLLALFLVFSFTINTLDMVWHGLQAPNWLNYRYSFMFCFLIVYMAARAFLYVRHIKPSFLVGTAASLILLIAVAQYFQPPALNTQREHLPPVLAVYLSALLLILYAGLLLGYLKRPGRGRRLFKKVLLLVVIAEAFTGSMLNLVSLYLDVGYSSRGSYVDYLQRWQGIIDEVKESDPDFYRMEKLPYRRMNDPSALGYRGVTASTSTLHAKTIAFLEYMGISADSHWSEYAGSSPVTDSILGIRYVMDYMENDRVTHLYNTYLARDGLVIYRNSYALPIAFCVSNDINSISFRGRYLDEDGNFIEDGRTYLTDVHSVFDRMNRLLAVMLGEDEPVQVYVPVAYERQLSGVRANTTASHTNYQLSVTGEPGTITFTVESAGDKEVFLHFPSDYMRDGNTMTINGTYTTPWFSNSYFGTAYIGVIPEGETATVTITTGEKGCLIYTHVPSYFYAFDPDAFTSAFERLLEGGIELSAYTEDSFRGTLTSPAGMSTVMTTIPYDKGWQVTVDGQAIETYETLDALMAFDVSEGPHTIEMKYMPKEYRYALGLFLVGVGLFGSAVLAEYVFRLVKSRRGAAVVPREDG
ncbi:MAG: YfhO family protein [Eubacteriales bacterium]